MRALIRAGNWNNTTQARTGLIVNTNNTPANTNNNIGFRADSDKRQKLQSQGTASSAISKGTPVHVGIGSAKYQNRKGLFGRDSEDQAFSTGESMIRYGNLYSKIYDLENLYEAYRICLRGKRLRREALPFTFDLSRNLLEIQRELKDRSYQVGEYFSFYIYEPKKRLVQALPFRDRIIQQALCLVITPLIERSFIPDTYACIKNRGTHAGSAQLQRHLRQAQGKWKRPYCLKCDIASYFPSINHNILLSLFEKKIKCPDTLWLIKKITNSNGEQTGIPIGNLLSQLSANLYLSLLDHYVKEKLKIKLYVRYMDDFCLIHGNKTYLNWLKDEIGTFLWDNLKLNFNSRTSIFPVSQGVDFLGYRTWETHKLIRNKSKNRMRRKLHRMQGLYARDEIALQAINASIQSWLGHCKHADTYRLRTTIISGCSFKKLTKEKTR